MTFNRFERKLLAAIVVATAMPLVGALVLGQGALREAYRVGVNPRVREQLDSGLALYRAHFTALRKHARKHGWPVRDYRTGRKAAKIGIPAAAGVGAVAGGAAAAVAVQRRRR